MERKGRKKSAVTQQHKGKLPQSEDLFRFLAENSLDALWQLDLQFRFLYVSPATKNILGLQNEEIIGRSLFSILTPESGDSVKAAYAQRLQLQANNQIWGGETYTVEALHKDGRPIWVEVTVNPIFDDSRQLTGYNGITRDINERRKKEEDLQRCAFLDPLTALPNRRLFEDKLERTVNEYGPLKLPFAVVFLDIDGLKKVNDNYGHGFGDTVLQVVAERFRHAVRKEDFIARLAGDEFMVIVPGIGDSNAVGFIAGRLVETCSRPIVIGKELLRIGVSVGVSFFPSDADNAAMLMNYADQAMYKAKGAGGNCYICFDPEHYSA